MPTFAYKARNTGSQLIEGVLDGANASAVVDLLLGQGLTPVEIKESKAKTTKSSSGLNVTLFKQKVTHIDLLLFSRQMHTLLKSGVPIMRALSGLQDAAINPEMRRVIGEVRESLEGGREPVSYTHLDVYKRQGVSRTGKLTLHRSIWPGGLV